MHFFNSGKKTFQSFEPSNKKHFFVLICSHDMMVISLKAQACLELADRAGMIQGYKLRPDKIDRWLKTLHFGAHYYCE